MRTPEKREIPSIGDIKEAIRRKDFSCTLEQLIVLRNFLIGQVPPYCFLETEEFRKMLDAFLSRIKIENGILKCEGMQHMKIVDLGDGGMSRLNIYAENGVIDIELGNSTHAVREKWAELEK